MSGFYADRNAKINFDTPEHLVTALLKKGRGGKEGRGRFRLDDVSHWLCVVRRPKLKSPDSPFTVEPISAFVRQLLLTQVLKWREQDRLAMMKRFSRIPGASGWRGVIFESCTKFDTITDRCPFFDKK